MKTKIRDAVNEKEWSNKEKEKRSHCENEEKRGHKSEDIRKEKEDGGKKGR